jgi:hypothetical protein
MFDPRVFQVSVKNLFSDLETHYQSATNPVCVFNGGFFEPGGYPTFSLIESGQVIPGAKDSQYPSRILQVENDRLSVTGIGSVSSTSQFGLSGLSPSFYHGDTTVTNRTAIGVKDNFLFVVFTQTRTIDQIVGIFALLGVPEDQMIALDSGYSSQFKCGNGLEFPSTSVIGSSLIISSP